MINSTNTVNIDGAAISEVELKRIFSSESDDKFVRWVVRPVALLAAIGVGVAVFFASAFLIMISLALLPILAVAMWAMKTSIDRELKEGEPVLESGVEAVTEHGQTAS